MQTPKEIQQQIAELENRRLGFVQARSDADKSQREVAKRIDQLKNDMIEAYQAAAKPAK